MTQSLVDQILDALKQEARNVGPLTIEDMDRVFPRFRPMPEPVRPVEGAEYCAKIADRYASNNKGGRTPEAYAAFTVATEIARSIRALLPPEPRPISRDGQEIFVVCWEWTEETKYAGSRFWGAHSAENDGRIADWPKIGMRPIGAAKVTVQEGIGLHLLDGSALPPAPKMETDSDLDEIREALCDDVISSYPDFTMAVSLTLDEVVRLRAELARLHSERSYIVGHNDGFAFAVDQAAELVEHNAVQDTAAGKVLIPRQDGNRDGLHYAAAIRALADVKEGSTDV